MNKKTIHEDRYILFPSLVDNCYMLRLSVAEDPYIYAISLTENLYMLLRETHLSLSLSLSLIYINPPLKDELIISFGMLFQMCKFLVQRLVINVVHFVFPPSVFISKRLHRAVVA